MAKKLILKFIPDPILRQKAAAVGAALLGSSELQTLVLDMEKTMNDSNGIGLAAPQVGRSLRLAVIKTQDGILPLVNPKILSRSLAKEIMEEGCLSIPGVYGLVKRSKSIKVSAADASGKRKKFSAKGMMARVIQHEIDHLNGVLFIDKAKTITEGREILKDLESKKPS